MSIQCSPVVQPHPSWRVFQGLQAWFPPHRLARTATITAAELRRSLTDPTQTLILVDVRNAHEYASSCIPGSILLPLAEIQAGAGIAVIRELLDRQRRCSPHHPAQLILICKAGVRSTKAVQLLQQAGIQGINLIGGVDAWNAAG